MAINNALAGIAVAELEPAIAWYSRLLGRGPTKRPMPTDAEWGFDRGGWIQLFVDPDRAGRSSVTLVEDDLAARLEALDALGIAVRDRHDGDDVKTAIVDDPDGNQIVFAEAVSDAVGA